MNSENSENKKSVQILSPEVARKIAAGEVIDKPCAIVRELMDNAVDSGAGKIDVEIYGGGIEKIRVIDNGSGMTKEDLLTCAHPHATSKISSEEDLLSLSTLGFRGEALSSMAAVSRLEIISGGWKMNASVTEDHLLSEHSLTKGTIVQTSRLFENFPARRIFLKRAASEAQMCRTVFEEKVLPRPDIEFTFSQDGEKKLLLPAVKSLKERFCQTMEFFESEDLFYEIGASSPNKDWSFRLVIGEPSVSRNSRKNIFIYINGRKIQEYSLVQAIEYGADGFFPNGQHPVACLFAQINPELVDFNIHPAKKEVRFKDINPLHHGVSSTVRNFFRQYTNSKMIQTDENFDSLQETLLEPQKNFSVSFSDFKNPVNESLAKIASADESQIDENQSASFEENSFYSQKQNFNPNHDSKYLVNHSSPRTSSFADRRSSFISNFSFSADDSSKKSQNAETENFFEKNFKANFIEQNENKADSDGFRFIGSALGTFLIAEQNDVLYIIDQHAAHERMIFNELMEKAGEKQNLLLPYTIETSSDAEDKWLETIFDNLNEAGFTCKKSEKGKWEFTTVPVRWKGNETDLKRDLLDKRINPKDLLRGILASTACRSAVMDGTVLDRQTAAEIAKGALQLPDPHCPHGRPVFTKITRKQLFELVKRT